MRPWDPDPVSMSSIHRMTNLFLTLAIGGLLCVAPVPGVLNAFYEASEQDTENAAEESISDSLEEAVRNRESRQRSSARERRLAEKLHGRFSHAPQHELVRVVMPARQLTGHRWANGLTAPLRT